MTPAARIEATLELLKEIADLPRPADALVSAYFRARRYIGSHDRGDVSARLYAVLRHQARLDWWLDKTGASRGPRGRLLVWLVLGEKLKAKSIDEMFNGGKFNPEPLTKEEQAGLCKLEGGTVEHPDMPEATRAECPPAMLAPLKQKFGDRFLDEMRAMQEPAPLDLRINPLKASREDIVKELNKLGFKAQRGSLSPWSVRVFDRPALNALPMLKNGLVEIQDEGSQLVALAVGAKPGERICDFCAGAGGKTLALAAMMHNTGKIMAFDIREGRLARSSERFRRAGVFNVETRVLKSERDPWIKKHKGSFDRVLVDAPCGGTGTWRRNPDARWRESGEGMAKLVKTQAAILDSAARLVKAGGRLVYATCSLLPEENERQAELFLAAHPAFAAVPCGLKDEMYLSLSPARHGTDGFFAAAFERKSEKGSEDLSQNNTD